VLKAALAPTPGKPHRVCDSCFLKLKNADTNSNNVSKRNAPTRRSIDSREKPEIRPSKLVATPSAEPVKYMEVKSAKSDAKAAESIMKASQASAILQLGFAAQFGALQPMGMSPALAMSPAMTAFSLAPPSPYTKKTKSPPAAAIPQSSKVDFDHLQKSNELLNQELLKLQSQVTTVLYFTFYFVMRRCFL